MPSRRLRAEVPLNQFRRHEASPALFDVDLAHAFLLTNDFDLIANLVGQPDGARNRLNKNKWRGSVRRVHLHVFDSEHAIKKRLSRFEVFHPIQFQRVGHFTENALRDFEALSRQVENFTFRLEITGERNKDRHDEPAKKSAQNENAKILPLR